MELLIHKFLFYYVKYNWLEIFLRWTSISYRKLISTLLVSIFYGTLIRLPNQIEFTLYIGTYTYAWA